MNESNDKGAYYFHQGTNFYSYEYLGCNLSCNGKKHLYTFRVWAPNADDVFLVSDFTDWETGLKMKKITDGGIYECTYTSYKSMNLSAYKFKIINGNKILYKGDPYAKYSKGGSDGASLIYESRFVFKDSKWLLKRKNTVDKNLNIPINIYEVHLGSFIRREDNTYYSYTELANLLVPYLKYMGYTHIELLPICEFPYDGSWGYQVCGFFAPTARFGNPDEFRNFINIFHENGLGVIMDWVPAHFPKDEWGLYEFDGVALYEYQGLDRQESKTWGTRFFDVGREEVQSFLVSSALYFFREFHIDGIRVDAVASMLYLDYDREAGEWIENSYGTNENLEAVSFFKKLNRAVKNEFPDALMIAEESGSYSGGVTKPEEEGGLGFDLKWNMGWANDFYKYVGCSPLFRKYHHSALTFPLMYAFSEKYVLPVSHDEVVHGKKSLIDKMYGNYEDKFRQMRIFLLLMMTYPGKKLLFMGTEFAQFREWNFGASLEWFMLDYPKHYDIRKYVAELNRFYLKSPELWELDFSFSGFEWIYPDESEKNTVAYKRKSSCGEIIVIINFSGTTQNISINTNGLDLTKIFSSTEEEKINIRNSLNGCKELEIPAFFGAVFKTDDGKIKIKL